MALSVHWFLPTGGDSRDVAGFGAAPGDRPANLEYLSLVAGAAERAGFDAVLTPTGTWCEDAWLTTAALLRETVRLPLPRRLPAGLPVAHACRRSRRPPSSGCPRGASSSTS